MMPIRQLAPDVAAKIAAGEVVERPASVVKELIENSIDAGAAQIRVDLNSGGLQLIRVTDNGCGIPPDELPLALSRHATSKVERIDDLEHIRSLGFRGEALASIAAVADVTLLSRHEGEEQGAQMSAANGQLSEVSAAASPSGTTLIVRNLFSAVPARLKFLKSRHAEVSHCLHMLEQYALAYPEIRFSVHSEGKQLFATPGDGQLMSVMVELYGLQIAEQMVPISSLDGRDGDPERPVVTGYTSRPSCYKSTRQHISFFVNRRWVLSRILTTAVEEGYHSLLLAGRHPIAVVNIQLDPALLDVNVHPAKTEIRFLRERRVYAAVLRAVRQGILIEPAMPRWSRDTPDDDDVPASENLPSADDIADTDDPETENDNPTYPQDNPWLTVTEEETGTKPPLLARLWQSHVRATERVEEDHASDDAPEYSRGDGLSSPVPTPMLSSPVPTPFSSAPTMNDHAGDDARAGDEMRDGRPERGWGENGRGWGENGRGQAVAPTMNDHADNDVPEYSLSSPGSDSLFSSLPDVLYRSEGSQHLPKLRVVGQLSQSYIVTEGDDGMYLIDQHAAHERILLERMVAALKERAPISQMLLSPIALSLAPTELEAIEEHLPQLEHIGFGLHVQDDGSVLVQALPNVFVKQMNDRSLHELLADLTSADYAGHTDTWEEHALANVACKAAIKANYFLTVSEMREMIEQLGATNAPFSCCHGRPTMIHFSLPALAREFERR